MMKNFVVILSPFAPHIAEELWEKLGSATAMSESASWVPYDPSMLVSDEVMIVVQVNGKIRAKFSAPKDTDDAELKKCAYAEPNVKAHTDGKTIVKEIVIRNKLVNIVAQ